MLARPDLQLVKEFYLWSSVKNEPTSKKVMHLILTSGTKQIAIMEKFCKTGKIETLRGKRII